MQHKEDYTSRCRRSLSPTILSPTNGGGKGTRNPFTLLEHLVSARTADIRFGQQVENEETRLDKISDTFALGIDVCGDNILPSPWW